MVIMHLSCKQDFAGSNPVGGFLGLWGNGSPLCLGHRNPGPIPGSPIFVTSHFRVLLLLLSGGKDL